MNATARGISEHEVLMMIEHTRMRLDGMGIIGPLADRLILTLVLLQTSCITYQTLLCSKPNCGWMAK